MKDTLTLRSIFAISAAGWLLLFPVSDIRAGTTTVIDSDGNGSESVSLIGADSFDPDGAIIDYEWRVNNSVVAKGFGPKVGVLQYVFNVGTSEVKLKVRDDAKSSNETSQDVTVKAQGANKPPVISAVVPDSVKVNSKGLATFTADASGSSDPEGDPIVRYVWTEGPTVLSDGTLPSVSLTLTGIRIHTLTLSVTSRDTDGASQTVSKDFNVSVNPLSESLAGIEFRRVIGEDFSFSDTYGDYAGLTFNALTQTYYISENKADVILEFNPNGSLVRTINISGLKAAGEPEADAEGIAWMYGETYAIVMEGAEEMAVVNITPTTTSLNRSQATFYDLSGDPKGVAYKGSEDALYWVSEDNPMRLVKSRINKITGELDQLENIDLTGLPASNLVSVEIFPRLSSNIFVMSSSSNTIMEVDITAATPVMKSSFSISGWEIPGAGGMAFGADGKFVVVGKRQSGAPEDDFNVFEPVIPILNKDPVAVITDPNTSGS